MSTKQKTPDALLFIAPGCPHCPTVLAALSELVKEARLGRLEVVNIAVHPQAAEQLGVRSAPWLKLGDFEFEGLHSAAELRHWADKASTPAGLTDYFSEELKGGRLPRVAGMVAHRPERLAALLTLAEDADTELAVRIGVSAVIEDLAGSPALLAELPALQRLAASGDPRVRADACHFLALTGSRDALPTLERLAQDSERSVSDVAHDCLADLRASIEP